MLDRYTNEIGVVVRFLYQAFVPKTGGAMAKIVAFVKASYLDKKNETRVIIEYTHLYERWRLNTGIKVNPEIITCTFDEDTELWKLSGLKQLKPAERKKLSAQNEVLRELNLKITRDDPGTKIQ